MNKNLEDDIEKVWEALNDWFDASGSENDEEFESVCNSFENILNRLDHYEK